MSDKKTAKITGYNVFGEERVYEFNLLSAWDGVSIFHEYSSMIMMSAPQIVDIFKRDIKEHVKESMVLGTGTLVELCRLIPQVLTVDRLERLSRVMLAGAKVGEDIADENGMVDVFGSEPLELYTAIFWAAAANYPKYIDPLLEALQEGDEDSTRDSSSDQETRGRK